jgi:[methyl-Co(III) methanol-specific corrinoid protein]:coenzyme M methyltransferase
MMNMAVTELMESAKCGWPEAHMDSTIMARLTLAANRFAGIENGCRCHDRSRSDGGKSTSALRDEPNVAVYPMDTVADIDRLSQIDVTAGRAGVCVNAIHILRKKVPQIPVFANLTGPVSLATSLVDPLIFYRALIKNKESVHKLMRT